MKKRGITYGLAAVLLAALLSGCKSSPSPEGTSTADNRESSENSSDELYVYNWGEYIDEDVITQFEEETGIRVIYDPFETNEEMYPIIEAGAISR